MNEILVHPIQDYDINSDDSFAKSLRLPYYSVLNYYNIVNCTSYYEMSFQERINHGYFKFSFFSVNGQLIDYTIPFSCY